MKYCENIVPQIEYAARQNAIYFASEDRRKPINIGLADFFAPFRNGRYTKICFRSIWPDKNAPKEMPRHYAEECNFFLEELEDEALRNEASKKLASLNEHSGIYFVVNAGGKTKNMIREFVAAFTENDVLPIAEQHKRLDEAPLKTSIRVETKKSVHAYWLLNSGCTAEQWKELQHRLAVYFGDNDGSLNDAPQLMRVPGFDHLSWCDGKLSHKLVECVEFEPERRYSIEEMLESFPAVEGKSAKSVVSQSVTVSDDAEPLDGEITYYHQAWFDAALQNEVQKVRETSVGGRDNALNKAAFRLGQLIQGGGLDEDTIIAKLYSAAEANGQLAEDSENRILRTIESGLNAGKREACNVAVYAEGGEYKATIEKRNKAGEPKGERANGDNAGTGVATRKAKELVSIGEAAELFLEPGGNSNTGTYATVKVGEHFETHRIGSEEFRMWLLHEYSKTHGGEITSNNTLQSAIDALKAKAYFSGNKYQPSIRISERGGKLYYDLGDDAWRVVEIDAEGWRILDKSPVKFIRPRGFAAQVEPVRGGSLNDLRHFINIKADNDWKLFVGWIISSFRPTGAYALLSLAGTQDAAKSTTTKLIRKLIDPSTSLVRSQPKEERDLMVGAKNNWLLAFDNLSYLPEWLSDALCRLATGGGQANRQNYTDGDEYLFDAMRPVVMNGIEELATRPDLVDRTINVFLPSLQDSARKDEATLYAEYTAALPRILGAIFDVLSVAIRELPNVRLDRLPRMADVCKFVTAAEPALGWEGGTFLKTYEAYRKAAKMTALEASIFGFAVYEAVTKDSVRKQTVEVQGKAEWKCTATELLNVTTAIAEQFERKNFPKSPRSVSGALRRLAPSLKEFGIQVELPESAERINGVVQRQITFTWVKSPQAVASPQEL